MLDSGADFLGILRGLVDHEVEFIVVGGVCAVLHGAPVTTFDLDVVHRRSPENIARLQAALAGLGAHYRGRPGPPLANDRHSDELMLTAGYPYTVWRRADQLDEPQMLFDDAVIILKSRWLGAH